MEMEMIDCMDFCRDSDYDLSAILFYGEKREKLMSLDLRLVKDVSISTFCSDDEGTLRIEFKFAPGIMNFIDTDIYNLGKMFNCEVIYVTVNGSVLNVSCALSNIDIVTSKDSFIIEFLAQNIEFNETTKIPTEFYSIREN